MQTVQEVLNWVSITPCLDFMSQSISMRLLLLTCNESKSSQKDSPPKGSSFESFDGSSAATMGRPALVHVHFVYATPSSSLIVAALRSVATERSTANSLPLT
eukprot:4574592-Amphidinium_carterae.1